MHSLYETADFDAAVNALRNDARAAVVTRSEKGCLVVTRSETDAVPACPVERLVDATGAGDLFAAGFLVGMARGADYRTSARLGALAAAEVIQHLGARPETSLKAWPATTVSSLLAGERGEAGGTHLGKLGSTAVFGCLSTPARNCRP